MTIKYSHDYQSAGSNVTESKGIVVYLVWRDCLDSDMLEAVYLSREAAEAHLAQKPNDAVGAHDHVDAWPANAWPFLPKESP